MNTRNNNRPVSWLGFAYALFCYAATLGGLGVFVLFVSGVELLPRLGGEHSPAVAIAINLGLILFWGVQHSVMARQGFKEKWTRIIPAHTERATYCLASALALAVVCLFWVPIGGMIWQLSGALEWAVRGVSGLGWLILLAASFEIDHFELFGLKQPFEAARGTAPKSHAFQQRYLYRLVRHPIQLGVLVGMWATPELSVGTLLFALAMTGYIHVGLFFEERALVREFGAEYEAYRLRVPKVLPWPRPRQATASEFASSTLS